MCVNVHVGGCVYVSSIIRHIYLHVHVFCFCMCFCWLSPPKYILSQQPTHSWLTIDALGTSSAEFLLSKSATDQCVC